MTHCIILDHDSLHHSRVMTHYDSGMVTHVSQGASAHCISAIMSHGITVDP